MGFCGKKGLWFFVDAPFSTCEAILLEGRERKHAEVRRVRRDETVVLFNGKGTVAQAVVKEVRQHCVVCHVKEVHKALRTLPEFSFAVAWHGEIRDFVRNAAAMGAASVVIFPGQRSHSRKISEEKLLQCAVEGCKQAHNPFLPAVKVHTSRDFSIPSDAHVLVLHPDAEEDISGALKKIPASERIFCFVVGPEGGWEKKEIQQWCEKGYPIVKVWDNVIKTELIPVFVAGVLKGFGEK